METRKVSFGVSGDGGGGGGFCGMGNGFCGWNFCYAILGLRIGDFDDCGDGGADIDTKSYRLLLHYCCIRCHRACGTFFGSQDLSPSSGTNVQAPLLHNLICRFETCESFDNACGDHPCLCSKILGSYPSAVPLDPPRYQDLSAAVSDGQSPHQIYSPLYRDAGDEAGPLPPPFP